MSRLGTRTRSVGCRTTTTCRGRFHRSIVDRIRTCKSLYPGTGTVVRLNTADYCINSGASIVAVERTLLLVGGGLIGTVTSITGFTGRCGSVPYLNFARFRPTRPAAINGETAL